MSLCQWLPCDHSATATSIEGGWAFCERHHEQHTRWAIEQHKAKVRAERLERRKNSTLRRAIENLHADGYTDAEMAQQLATSPACIRSERKRMGLAPNRTSRDYVMPCGTHSAFNRHVSHGEEPCDNCRLAERVYQRESKRRRRAKQQQVAA